MDTISNLKKMKKAELIEALQVRDEIIIKLRQTDLRLRAEIKQLKKEADLMVFKINSLQDAFTVLNERHEFNPVEMAQLNVGKLVVTGEGEKNILLFHSLNDLADASEHAMKRQATVAKFRQLKGHFVQHQRAVTHILDRLDGLGKKNYVSGEDMNKLRAVRSELAFIIRREL